MAESADGASWIENFLTWANSDPWKWILGGICLIVAYKLINAGGRWWNNWLNNWVDRYIARCIAADRARATPDGSASPDQPADPVAKFERSGEADGKYSLEPME